MDGGTPTGPKGELQARLEVLFRRYAAGLDPRARLPAPDEIVEHFRAEIRTLVAEYGHEAVDAALDAIPRDGWPSASLH